MAKFPDNNVNMLNIVPGVIQRDNVTPYLLLICLDYVLRVANEFSI